MSTFCRKIGIRRWRSVVTLMTDHFLDSTTAKTILTIAYGIDVKPKNDPYVDIAEKALHTLADSSLSPMNYVLEAFPWLRPHTELDSRWQV